MKLSASALSAYLRSPKGFYYGYIKRLEPLSRSVTTFDHDKILGSLYSEFVDRFYKGMSEVENTRQALLDWAEQTEGWLPPKTRDRYTAALTAWATHYHQQFSPTDGCRVESELKVENRRFVGYLDGMGNDGILVEAKTCSRAPQLSAQLEKIQNSIQVKLYAVMTEAKGVVIELAFKDSPYAVFRAPVLAITATQRLHWELELNALADSIYALGEDEHHYPCHTDCTIITKNFVGSCPYQALCLGMEGAEIGFKHREHRK